MTLDDVLPAHCHARALRLVDQLRLIREEMGRSEDTRAIPEIANAAPREVYFEAIAAWHKADRLCSELGVRTTHPAPAAPALTALKPGHCLQLIDAVGAQLDLVAHALQIHDQPAEHAEASPTNVGRAAPPEAVRSSIDKARQPSDVLMTLIRANRELSRVLERPFTPSDVHHTVALAVAYASRLGPSPQPPAFERKRRPTDCYQRLEACLELAGRQIAAKGQTALAARGTPADILPTDVYDLANVVLGEVAFLHALSPNAPAVHAFEPGAYGHRLPAHVYQLVRTLEGQLAALR
jgi:hypothetical protein